MNEQLISTPVVLKKQFPCEQCGAKLEFAPGTSVLKCPYCGYENPIPESREQIQELDYHSYLEKAGEEQDSHEALRIKCEQCGAETTMPAGVTSGICPFCGSNMVFTGKSSRLIKPASLLPFKITPQQAFEKFQRWINRLWFAPGELKRYARSEGKLVGVYTPYWTFDADTTSDYHGMRGDYYYVTETYTANEDGRPVTRTRQVRKTRWTPVSRTVGNSFDDLLVLASKSLPRKYAERLGPWDLANLVPYADEYLSGFRAESYQVSLAEGFQTAQELMDLEIRRYICRDIGGDEQNILSVKTQHGKITFKHILLPMWLSAYRFKERVYHILVNARTGDVEGERPYSPWKIAAAALAALIVIAVIAAIASAKH